jgi:AhpD family alkylhydroperoxidase
VSQNYRAKRLLIKDGAFCAETHKWKVLMALAARISLAKHASTNFEALFNLSVLVKQSSLGERLVELINLRVSQINGCGLCIDLHWRDLILQGVEPRHVNAVFVWHEAPFSTERERAALRGAEILNGQLHTDASDDEFALVSARFSDTEIVELGYAMATIRAWNTLNLSLRNPIPEVPAPGF